MDGFDAFNDAPPAANEVDPAAEFLAKEQVRRGTHSSFQNFIPLSVRGGGMCLKCDILAQEKVRRTTYFSF